jgi:hypothetical protein
VEQVPRMQNGGGAKKREQKWIGLKGETPDLCEITQKNKRSDKSRDILKRKGG